MRQLKLGLTGVFLATLFATGCLDSSLQLAGTPRPDTVFDIEATRVVRRAGMTDDRPVNAVAATTAWFTLVRRRVTVPLSTAQVLVVAGGGGGGGSTAGGGGGGGFIYQTYALTPATTYSVTVGAGGAGSPRADMASPSNTNGGNSVFGSLTAIGGGSGGAGRSSGSRHANAGGSGGGGGYYPGNDINPILNGAGTAGQGFAGGPIVGATATMNWCGGGGGGAGGTGADGTHSVTNGGGAGGPGLASAISGVSTYYAGGGGGAHGNVTFGTLGGVGGGGSGGGGSTVWATAGTPETGGGGGGGSMWQYGPGGAAGGSGIVIVRYTGSLATVGGTKTTVGGDTVHTFTGSGTFTTP